MPSAGDEVVITFDRLTNRGVNAKPVPPTCEDVGWPCQDYVDFYFIFTPPLGTYTGDFRDDSTFVINIEESASPDCGLRVVVVLLLLVLVLVSVGVVSTWHPC